MPCYVQVDVSQSCISVLHSHTTFQCPAPLWYCITQPVHSTLYNICVAVDDFSASVKLLFLPVYVTNIKSPQLKHTWTHMYPHMHAHTPHVHIHSQPMCTHTLTLTCTLIHTYNMYMLHTQVQHLNGWLRCLGWCNQLKHRTPDKCASLQWGHK